MRVTVDENRCQALGVCESLDPDRFAVDDDGELEILRVDVAPDEVAGVERAVSNCPTHSLSLLED